MAPTCRAFWRLSRRSRIWATCPTSPGWNDYIDRFPHHLVGEIHLGGHDAQTDDSGAALLIDAHGSEVTDPVWALYARTIRAGGAKPTLIEWDNDVPGWPVLAAEAARATAILNRVAA